MVFKNFLWVSAGMVGKIIISLFLGQLGVKLSGSKPPPIPASSPPAAIALLRASQCPVSISSRRCPTSMSPPAG